MGFQVCSRCVMDNAADETIRFEKDGTCNYCNYALARMSGIYFPNDEGARKIESMIDTIKREGKGKRYDCLMGLSGGLDSTYLAYLGARKWDLRILGVHIDDGFDNEIAKRNIENLSSKFGITVIYVKPDEKQYMDVLKSFIRAGVPNIAIPQDNLLLAYLDIYARKFKMKYFLSGANFALESILQRGNGTVAADCAHIRDIQRRFGEVTLKDLPIISPFEQYVGQKYLRRIKKFRPLDWIDYKKEKAIKELEEHAGFEYYGGKHYESIFTKFVQVYYLPKKFGIDKRKSHFSSMIISGQMTRSDALEKLGTALYKEEEIKKDINYILSKLNMSQGEFEKIMNSPGRAHRDYRVSVWVNFTNLARKFRKYLSD